MANPPPEPAGDSPPANPGLEETVTELLGRRPQGDYTIAVSRPDGRPVVLANAPFLHSGRPMPTRYWLIDPHLNKAIGRLESIGGVKAAEAAVDPTALAACHDRYRRERDRLIPADHQGPAPSGGVGGTREGVKCLHAHYAYHLAGGDDPIGRWVEERLVETGDALDKLVVSQPVRSRDDEPGDGPTSPVVGSQHPVVTIDIGSDSTEFVARLESGEVGSVTLPIGASTITADYLHHDPPDPAELSAALSVVELYLDDIGRERPDVAAAVANSEIVGLGVVRFVAEVEVGVADGDAIDGYLLERDAAEELFRALATEAHEDRAANPGLDPDHVEWIVGAMCILLEFMRQFGVPAVRVSTGGGDEQPTDVGNVPAPPDASPATDLDC